MRRPPRQPFSRPWLRLAQVVLLTLVALGWCAAAEMNVQRFGVAHGLSGHPVTDIAQDRLGRLWVGTMGGGVFRYDGISWRQMTSLDGLLSNAVVALVPGSQGEVWVCTAAGEGGPGGLSIVNGGTIISTVPGAEWEIVSGLEAVDGVVWFAFRAGGVARYKDGLLEPLVGLSDVRVRRLVEGADGDVWFAGGPIDPTRDDSGILARARRGQLQRFGSGAGLPRAPFNDLIRGTDGDLWLATGAGLYRGKGGTFRAATFDGASTARELHAVSEDARGRLWLGATGAVLRVAGDTVSELKLPVEIGPVPVFSVAGSPLGGVFARTPSHLLRLEGRTAEILPLPDRASLLPPGADPLDYEARMDAILDTSTQLLIDHEGSSWANTGREIVRYLGDEARRFGRADGLPSDDVRVLLVDSVGRLWAGTNLGLARYDRDVGFFQPVPGVRDEVRALFEDRGGYIYLATATNIFKVAPNEGAEVGVWAAAEGLAGVRAIAADATGTMWLGGAGGLARTSLDGLVMLGVGDGLAATEVTSLLSVGEELWVGHPSGLTRLRGDLFVPVAAFDGIAVSALLPPLGVGTGPGEQAVAVTPDGLRTVPDAALVAPEIGGARLAGAYRSGDTTWLGLDVGLLKHRAGASSLLSGGAYPTDPIAAVAYDGRGFVWLATARGIYRHADRTTASPVRVEPFGVPHWAKDEPFRLAGDRVDLWVRFAAVSFLGPRGSADLRFETRLIPRDSAWSPATVERERHLLDLRPGAYLLEVRSLSRELSRSEPSRLTLIVGEGIAGDAISLLEGAAEAGAEGAAAPVGKAGDGKRLVLPDIAKP